MYIIRKKSCSMSKKKALNPNANLEVLLPYWQTSYFILICTK